MTNFHRLPAAVIAFALLGVCSAHAQTVLNPRTVEFDPSADHAALTADGQPVVQRYELQVFLAGASQPMTTANLAKPNPQADGKIRLDFSALLAGWPLTNGTYVARVAAVGPAGNGLSDPSNTFAFASCSITLGASTYSAPAGGSTGSVTVSAGTGCTWTAASDASWVVLSTTAGTGSGSVAFSVTPNLGGTSRAATLTIGTATVSITQPGVVACAYSLSATSAAVPSQSGSGSVGLTCGSNCGWTATSSESWAVPLTGSGTGSGTLSYTFAKNSNPTPRTATLTIGGIAYTLTQAAANRPTAPKKVRVSPAV